MSDLYAGTEDPRLAEDAATARGKAERFSATWRDPLAAGTIAAQDLRAALEEYEAILELAARPGFYASLLAAADTQDAAALALEQQTSEHHTELRALLVFFELGLGSLDDERFAVLVADPALARYAHYLRTLRRFKPHLLSEPEERVIARKDLGGRTAFVQLYDELAGSLRFRMPLDGIERDLTDGELMALLHHHERATRERALVTLLDVYATQRLPLAAILNALLLDHRVECDMRGYADVAVPTHLANELDPTIVATMMNVVEEHYPLIQEYLRLKARVLGLPRLGSADIYAPLDDHPESITYDAARSLILDAFSRFDGDFANLAARFFDGGWIDAEVRPAKRHGAFCAALGPTHHPYVLASYAGTSRDVATLAHELGHGVHYLLARRQTPLNYEPPLVLAETASVFAEMVVTDHLLAAAPDAQARRRILMQVLDEMYGTVFRQQALTRFELGAHTASRAGRLDADALSTLWWNEQARLFGDAVEMHPAYRFGWSYISHFVHSRFYCYAYSFGELLTLALFQRYREQGRAFVADYLDLLASGGSIEPAALLARLGFDVTSAAFWRSGCAVIAGMVDEVKRSL